MQIRDACGQTREPPTVIGANVIQILCLCLFHLPFLHHLHFLHWNMKPSWARIQAIQAIWISRAQSPWTNWETTSSSLGTSAVWSLSFARHPQRELEMRAASTSTRAQHAMTAQVLVAITTMKALVQTLGRRWCTHRMLLVTP